MGAGLPEREAYGRLTRSDQPPRSHPDPQRLVLPSSQSPEGSMRVRFQGSHRSRQSEIGAPRPFYGVAFRRSPQNSTLHAKSATTVQRNEASLIWGAAPDPEIFQGITPAFDDSTSNAPTPLGAGAFNSASSTRRRSGYPSAGCVSAEPASVSPDACEYPSQSYRRQPQRRIWSTKPTGKGMI